MDRIEVAGRVFDVRRAVVDDVPGLAALLADDVLGATRESGDLVAYERAFAAIDADPAHLLLAVRDDTGALVATMQLTLLPGLARGGATRLQVEAVRLAARARGGGLGSALFAWAHAWGAERGAVLSQLTTDRSRVDAHRFYERLGYAPSHTGFKRPL
ncbi:GNAT family N-acetyltransferase [Nocardioides marinquilinus]|uniref:GNAT family N-acetyltransferase n=1 Tax=Nocardioides marinquilinus TaxID=1210400 RepID=UPI0031E88E8B